MKCVTIVIYDHAVTRLLSNRHEGSRDPEDTQTTHHAQSMYLCVCASHRSHKTTRSTSSFSENTPSILHRSATSRSPVCVNTSRMYPRCDPAEKPTFPNTFTSPLENHSNVSVSSVFIALLMRGVSSTTHALLIVCDEGRIDI